MTKPQSIPEDHLEEYNLETQNMLNLATSFMVNDYGLLSVRKSSLTRAASTLALIAIGRELKRFNDNKDLFDDESS